ncbi:Probable RNA-directed DNA polymerase from transposon BS [Eumeta japonica]|uniref:Probable RNA-directed DNA polymerase from transposon BS n=1 Tax=Eumeta variegata TaxID=151549 RepID=A0A4C1XMU6_EUMVA|nr:Probable RNA-directed DNA polymerase from transposon BS [Eumeta japonica]
MQLAYFAISKAFDCVHHETLIGKLRHYGVTGRALDLLKSYLSNRVQRVDVNVRNKELEFVNSTVFLGITLDNRLQWGPHISKLAKRLSSAAYAVKKMRNLSDVETARLVYFGCFHSLMSYGILLWGNAADIQKIFVLQKRAVRAIYKLGPRGRTERVDRRTRAAAKLRQELYVTESHAGEAVGEKLVAESRQMYLKPYTVFSGQASAKRREELYAVSSWKITMNGRIGPYFKKGSGAGPLRSVRSARSAGLRDPRRARPADACESEAMMCLP